MELLRAAWRWYRRSPLRDAAFAAVMTAITVSGSYGEGHPSNPADIVQFNHHPIPHPTAGALLLVGAASVVLALRNRWPLAVLAVSTVLVLVYTLLDYVNGAALLAPAAAVYAVSNRLTVPRALVASGVTLAVLLTATAAHNPFDSATGGAVVVIPALFAAACLGGIAVANRRAYVTSIRDRAQEDARRRVDEERLRIARELHDVVAHTMATINVQAGTAAHVVASHPEAAAEALQAIKVASKDGLRELRAILNVLRQADESEPTQPAPGTAQIESLVDGARRAGLNTTLTVTGTPGLLPAAVDLAAYRIIQESLTNVIRHAGPATAAVSVRYSDDELLIDVSDTGRGYPAETASEGAGHGLAGMRERAAAVGGSLEAGPAPGGGFRVAARFPLPARPAAREAPAASAAPEPILSAAPTPPASRQGTRS
jgi:signal transduction histidine kinase